MATKLTPEQDFILTIAKAAEAMVARGDPPEMAAEMVLEATETMTSAEADAAGGISFLLRALSPAVGTRMLKAILDSGVAAGEYVQRSDGRYVLAERLLREPGGNA